jgi:citrate lyase subunit beta/citryl-CoA lyase
MVRKAGQRGADVLIFDLEDGVRPEAKDAARARLQGLWPELDLGGSEALLRVNAGEAGLLEADLDVAAAIRPGGVVLPKCESPEEVASVGARLGGEVPLFLMVETARGVLAARDLAAVPGLKGLLFGAADYRESLRAGRLPEEQELLVARSALVLAARAAGIEAYDTPWFEYRDAVGLQASAERARALGFDGKTAVHPDQVPVINRLFAPTAAEVERAEKIVLALEEAARRGRGVATVDGEMVEALHLAEARRTLRRARRAGSD